MNENNFRIEESTIRETDITNHERIGFGADGDVHRVTWRSKDGNIEAAAKQIKIPSDESRIQQLRFEIQVAQNFRHQNVINYYGHIVTETHVILVMEYAARGTLFRFLKTLRKKNPRTHLSSEQIHSWARQAAEGIQYLRKASLVHRDIKSPNLLIMADNTLKLCDFGLAKYLSETKSTYSGRGTFRWLAPEVWKDLKLSPKADVFAFGIVLWEMITGEEPYEGMRPEHILFSVAYGNKRPDIPLRCPDVYRNLLTRCWEDDRAKRPTIDEIVALLEGPKEAFSYPPGPPRKVTISSNRATQLTVSWSRPDDVGESPVIGYELKYRVLNSGEEWVNTTDDLTSGTSAKISGLKAGTKYEVCVAAVNNGGHGPHSEPETAVTVDASPARYAIFIALFLVVIAYTIYTVTNAEDFGAKHSWILTTQFAHNQSVKDAHVQGAQSVTLNHANGDIAVADWFPRTIKVYNSTGHLKRSFDINEFSPRDVTDKKARPRDVAISSNGSFFVTNETPYIHVFDSNFIYSHSLESSHLAAEYSRLSGITFTKNGQLSVGECRQKSISIYSKDGTRLYTFRTDVTPRYLAFTSQNTIVASSWEPHITLNGDVLHTLEPPKGVTKWRPTGVSCSEDYIFVGNDDTSAPDEYGIYCYSLYGDYLGIATRDVVNPSGVAVSRDSSKLIVAHWERGNPTEGRGLHGVKIFTKNILN